MTFLDTSGLLCCFNEREPHSLAAVKAFESGGKKLTHSYVLSEFTTLVVARKYPRAPAHEFVVRLLTHPSIVVVWVSEPLHVDALNFLDKRLDKGYSLCDSVSFILMQRHGIRAALTADHHFVQEGFNRLLGENPP